MTVYEFVYHNSHAQRLLLLPPNQQMPFNGVCVQDLALSCPKFVGTKIALAFPSDQQIPFNGVCVQDLALSCPKFVGTKIALAFPSDQQIPFSGVCVRDLAPSCPKFVSSHAHRLLSLMTLSCAVDGVVKPSI